MSLNLYDSHRETRDNLGSQDENKNLILLGAYKETIGIEMGATQVTITDIGTAWILGHAENGILGVTGMGLGAGTYGTPGVVRVVNPNDIFHEHFRYNNFNDSTATTGTFSTVYFNVSMDVDEVFQTTDIFKDLTSVQYATAYVDLTGTKQTTTADGEGGKIITLTEGQ